jgi:hypothetical protein
MPGTRVRGGSGVPGDVAGGEAGPGDAADEDGLATGLADDRDAVVGAGRL